jgi:hypothetical protein
MPPRIPIGSFPVTVIQPAAGIHVACPVMKERSLAP